MEHTYPFWTAVSVVVAVATTVTWWIVRRADRRDRQQAADLRSIEQWMQAREAMRRRQLVERYGMVVDLREEVGAGRDAGSTTVGHVLGAALVLAGLVLLMAVVGGVETAGL